MKPNEVMTQTFTAKEASAVFKGIGLNFDHDNLRDWHRKKLIPTVPVGSGRDRRYSFSEVVHIAVMAFLAPHMRYRGLFEAADIARDLAPIIERLCTASEEDGENFPAYVMVYGFNGRASLEEISRERKYRNVASAYAFRGAVMLSPATMAIELLARAEQICQSRKV